MTNFDQITTITKFYETKFKEKGSVFIGQAFPVENDKDVNTILDEIKKKYYDATHHCYAFKLIDNSFKYSDDGEPNGTAGIRILNAIEHFDLVSVLIVVIRYYGGTKLGVGPLGKAYYNSAFQTLEISNFRTKIPYFKVEITADFSQISHVHRILSNHDSKIEDSIYTNLVNFKCLIKPKDLESVSIQLQEISKGEIKVKDLNNIIYL